MRAEVEAHTRRLLEQEPTRSMSADRLRERLIAEMGDCVPGRAQLMKDLAGAPGIIVLDAPKTVRETFTPDVWNGAYDTALRAALSECDARVLLADGAAGSPDLITRAVADLAALAAGDAELRQALNAALDTADACERVMREAGCDIISPTPAEADHSTILLRDPPPSGGSRPRETLRSYRPPPRAKSRKAEDDRPS